MCICNTVEEGDDMRLGSTKRDLKHCELQCWSVQDRLQLSKGCLAALGLPIAHRQLFCRIASI